MRIHTTARHFELESIDREFAHARMEKFQRFAQDIHEIHLVVTAERYLHVAEITLHLKHRELAVREEAPEPRRAIDLAADGAERQLRRLHERRVDHVRSSRPVNGRADVASEAEGGEDGAIEDSQEA